MPGQRMSRPSKKKVTFRKVRSTSPQPCPPPPPQPPMKMRLLMHPREQMSYNDSVSRLRRGRQNRNQYASCNTPRLPIDLITKRVRFTEEYDPIVKGITASRRCCNGMHNGRFPSEVTNRVGLNDKGDLCVHHQVRSHAPDMLVNLLELPPAPEEVNLDCMQPRQFLTDLPTIRTIRTKDLDKFIAYHWPSSAPPDSPGRGKRRGKPKSFRPIPVATEKILENCWKQTLHETAMFDLTGSFPVIPSGGLVEQTNDESNVINLAHLDYISSQCVS